MLLFYSGGLLGRILLSDLVERYCWLNLLQTDYLLFRIVAERDLLVHSRAQLRLQGIASLGAEGLDCKGALWSRIAIHRFDSVRHSSIRGEQVLS